jgi:hypothetical protein
MTTKKDTSIGKSKNEIDFWKSCNLHNIFNSCNLCFREEEGEDEVEDEGEGWEGEEKGEG